MLFSVPEARGELTFPPSKQREPYYAAPELQTLIILRSRQDNMSTNQQSRLDKLKIRSHPAPDEFGTPASPPTAPAPDVDNMDLDSGSSHSSSKVPIEGAAPMDVNQMAAPTAGAVAPDSQSIPAASQVMLGSRSLAPTCFSNRCSYAIALSWAGRTKYSKQYCSAGSLSRI